MSCGEGFSHNSHSCFLFLFFQDYMKSFGHYCLINDQRIVPTIEEANANQNNCIYNYNDRNSQRSVIGTDLRNMRKEVAATKVPHEPILHDFTLQKFLEFEASLNLGMIIFI